MKYSIQIIPNDDIHDYAKDHYPNLYKEVLAHDKVTSSSWYELSEAAYNEYKLFRQVMKRRGKWTLGSLKKVHKVKEKI